MIWHEILLLFFVRVYLLMIFHAYFIAFSLSRFDSIFRTFYKQFKTYYKSHLQFTNQHFYSCNNTEVATHLTKQVGGL